MSDIIVEGNKPTDEVPVVSTPLVDAQTKQSFLSKTGIYGLEFAVAMITTIIVLSVLSIGVFALCGYFYGENNSITGQVALWSAASTIVWLPVAYIFYMRSRAYMERNPNVVVSGSQRGVVVVYQVIMLLSAILFAFSAVYSALNAFVDAVDMSKVLVTSSLPALISALLFGSGFVAFFKHPVVSRKTFGTYLIVVSLLIVIPVIAFSMVLLRGANQDKQRSADLNSLQSAVSSTYRDNDKLPANLDGVQDSVDRELRYPLSDYEYKVLSSTSYEICTDFLTDTKDGNQSSISGKNVYSHERGRQCYTDYVTPSRTNNIYRYDSYQ